MSVMRDACTRAQCYWRQALGAEITLAEVVKTVQACFGLPAVSRRPSDPRYAIAAGVGGTARPVMAVFTSEAGMSLRAHAVTETILPVLCCNAEKMFWKNVA